MQIQAGFSAGLQGLQQAQSGLTQATIDVARPSEPQTLNPSQGSATGRDAAHLAAAPDKTTALVSAVGSLQQGEAAVAVLDAESEMLGSIIDIEV